MRKKKIIITAPPKKKKFGKCYIRGKGGRVEGRERQGGGRKCVTGKQSVLLVRKCVAKQILKKNPFRLDRYLYIGLLKMFKSK